MKRNIILVLVLSIFAVNIIACTSKIEEREKNKYENILQNSGMIAETDYGYFISYRSKFLFLDKENYEFSPVCRDATCSHDNSVCMYNQYISCVKNYEGKILLVYNIPGIRNSDNIIYELNQDTYELSEYYKVDMDFTLLYFEIINNNIIFSAADTEGEESGWYIENMENGERKQLLDRIGYRSNISMDEDNLYLSTTEFEIYSINIETLDKKLIISNYCRDLILYNGRIYFLRYDLEKKAADLYSVKTDGTDEQLIKEYVFSFKVWNNKIYYITDNKNIMINNTFNMMDLDGENEKILIENQETTYDICILPNEEKLICFNMLEYEDKNQCAMMTFDGNNLAIINIPEIK